AGDYEGLMLLLGDQPGVSTEVIDLAARDWLANRSWAAVTSYRGELGHPFVFARSAFEDLRALHGDKAVWKLIEAYPQLVRRVEVDRELPPDIDTPEDYRRLLATWPAPAVVPRKQA
ncbi:MAG: nucleotidyltransferase family protein, partial [Vicinamibacteria bacterium]